MRRVRAASTATMTGAALVAFASNSVLCRIALRRGLADAATFTGVRLASGALALSLIVAAPDPLGAALMVVAGMAWGSYSLMGRGIADPLAATTGNFQRSALLAVPLVLCTFSTWNLGWPGAVLAAASGALASGVGYAVWYAALRGLTATRAAIVQLLVPVLAAGAGALVLDEKVSLRLLLSAATIFVGVGLAMLVR